MFENGVNLVSRDAGEPLQELINRGAAFEILKERAHRNARATKYPGSAEDSGISLHDLACAPIQHGYTLLRMTTGGNRACSNVKV